MDVIGVNDFRVGEVDSYHFEGINLARAAVDRVEIRSTNGSDRFEPACLELRFDGQPVYCNDLSGVFFGNGGADELAHWRDPDGLHEACRTCWPSSPTHGPMVGAVGPDRARIWVRADATREVRLRIAPDGQDPTTAPVAARGWPSPRRDFTLELGVTGLSPLARYAYAIEVDGADTRTGQFGTAAPAQAPGGFTFAYGSCTADNAQPIFAVVEQTAPDLFFFIGDNHYGNTSDVAALRWNYRWALERPERARLVAHTPVLATWDDHDFVGNNTDGFEPGKENALRVFDEYWANPGGGIPETPGVFFAHAWGDVDFFFVDDRYWRGFDDNLLGAAQAAWLMEGLARSRASFKFLVCGSQWTAAGSNDSWAAFDAAREALWRFIGDEHIGGVVTMSGDIHRSELRRLETQALAGYDIPELTSSPLANVFRSPCFPHREVRACVADRDSFIHVALETAVADPLLIATLYDVRGEARETWVIRRSELE